MPCDAGLCRSGRLCRVKFEFGHYDWSIGLSSGWRRVFFGGDGWGYIGMRPCQPCHRPCQHVACPLGCPDRLLRSRGGRDIY